MNLASGPHDLPLDNPADNPPAHDAPSSVLMFSLRPRGPVKLSTGDYVRSKTGRSTFRITGVQLVRAAQAPGSRAAGSAPQADQLRLKVERVAREDVPAGTVIHSWPEHGKRHTHQSSSPAPLLKPATPGVERKHIDHPPEREARAKAHRHRGRGAKRKAATTPEEDPAVPALRRMSIHATDGAVIRAATAVRDAWVDPDDNNPNRRTPKRISGWKSRDAVRTLAAHNRNVTPAMIAASDCYRQAAELAEGVGGGCNYEFVSRQFDQAASGPTETKIDRVRAFASVNAKFGHIARLLLSEIVVHNVDASAWAARRGWSVKSTTGALVVVLDQLAEVFKDRVSFAVTLDALRADAAD